MEPDGEVHNEASGQSPGIQSMRGFTYSNTDDHQKAKSSAWNDLEKVHHWSSMHY